ncbi:alkaline phosphatase [Paucibacter sp. APW11]|uniref:Alkaline phosphatase n=1 Tax=Roseateles aquae TaxID=3077235 RepID=A0ABU3PF31_9BURK|nr:alkaline phosphatase [Paucibacter sp. APW11]MDT9001143.1 alkaline phosphatase [Paucibacter sp. APW11]
MNPSFRLAPLTASLLLTALFSASALAAPQISRLTPPSELFASGNPNPPYIARFLPGQRFDLQATVRLDEGQTLANFEFSVDGKPVQAAAATRSIVTTGLSLPAGTNAAVLNQRAFSLNTPGVHKLTVTATQSDGQRVTAEGNFEIVALQRGGQPVKNVIILLGDGMGATHRTAARIIGRGYAQGKAMSALAMDTAPFTGLVMTSSLDGIVTDSAPGMSNYVTGNKANNNQEGVFPDDTLDAFDNPRVENLAEFLHRTQGKSLGVVTTADVFDATPAAMAVHTSDRGRGTGIVDQFLDDRHLTGLRVLLGGGRKWFLPNGDALKPDGSRAGQALNGSQRDRKSDYLLPADIVAGWGASAGALDPQRDLLQDFRQAGFAYAPDRASLAEAARADRLLGLFAYSNMNVAFDKIAKRRGSSTIVDDYGFPDQPMLDEMASAALQVLSRNKKGFVALIEGASIDKQAHLMDTDRWLLEVIEFDRAVQVAKDFAARHPDTLVIVTADHECSGAAIIGASTRTVDQMRAATATPTAAALRDQQVGTYQASRFPKYTIAADGYPQSTDVDFKMLIGYGANADRYENWLAHPTPTQDSQQPFYKQAPQSSYPANPTLRNAGSGYLVSGQVPGDQAVHTATDVPLSAFGRGARAFTGVMDNTDVFFKIGQAVLGGVR